MPYNVCEELVEPEPIVMYIDQNGIYQTEGIDVLKVEVDTKEDKYNELVEQVESKRQFAINKTNTEYSLDLLGCNEIIVDVDIVDGV